MDAESRFDELVRERTGPEFVDRVWLYEEIEGACAADADSKPYVLVSGEPGVGKTSLMAGLARRRPDWLRYFVRRDSWSRPEEMGLTAFLLTVGHQFARRRPELFATERLEVLVRQRVESVAPGGRVVGVQVDHLAISPFRVTAALQVEQQITDNAGEVVGLAAGSMTVDPRLERPEILAHLALIDPARLLLEDEPDARIVLLVDGTDELVSAPGGAELLDWLVTGVDLPSNVRLVLTSREHEALERLRRGRPGRLNEIRIDPMSREVMADLTAYAERALLPVIGLLPDSGHDPDSFVRQIVRTAAGNFQYLAAYGRGLQDAVARGDRTAAERLLRFESLPSGLDALYGFFMTTVQSDLERLGQLAAREPDAPRPDAWRDVGRPILGVLTVAREPLAVTDLAAMAGLTASREAIGDVLRRLRWLFELFEERNGAVALFHTSLAEFLTGGDPADPGGPSWAVDEPYWHGRIVRYYRGDAPSWDAVDWTSVDRYGLLHLAWHVLGSPGPVATDAVALVCPGLHHAIRTAFGSNRHFRSITMTIARHAIDARPLSEALPAALFLGVVRRQLVRTGRGLPPAVLGLMARLGRAEEALEYTLAVPPSDHRFQALREIFRHKPEEQDIDEDLVELLVESAMISGAEQLYKAAEILAPHDPAVATHLHEAIVRGLRCGSPSAAALPTEIDGVRLELDQHAS